MTVPVWQPGTIYLPGDVVQPATAPIVAAVALSNPGFESGTTNWTMGSFTIATDKVFAGTNSAKCVTAGAPEVVHSSSAVVPGVSITASCMFNQGPASAGQNSGRVVLIWYNSISAEISRSEGNNVTSSSGGVDGWKPSTVTASAPSGAAFVAVAGVTLKLTTQAVWFDSFSWNYVPSSATASFIYVAIQAAAGSSASSEPIWPVVLLGTVVDNQVTWEAHSSSRLEWTASSILVSGATEPTWPEGSGQTVSDNTIAWEAVVRNVDDAKCPNTKVVAILADKVYCGDDDIVAFSATTNPLDWSTVDDAGFLPTGLQQFGANPMAVLQPYRGNLACFNSQGLQMWQVDQDPARMALLDAFPVGSTYYQAASPVSNDLLFLTRLGVRTVGIAAGSTNLAAGDVGEPIDVLVQYYIRRVEAQTCRAFSTYFPSQGQYWLCFTDQTPNYITWDADNQVDITLTNTDLTAEITGPVPVTPSYSIIVMQGGAGFSLIDFNPDTLVKTVVATDSSGYYFQSRPFMLGDDYIISHALSPGDPQGIGAYRDNGVGGFTLIDMINNADTRRLYGTAKISETEIVVFIYNTGPVSTEAELYSYDGVAFTLVDTLALDDTKGRPDYMSSATLGDDALFVPSYGGAADRFIIIKNTAGTLSVTYSTITPSTFTTDVVCDGLKIFLSKGTIYEYDGLDVTNLQATTSGTQYCAYDSVQDHVVLSGIPAEYRLASTPYTSTNISVPGMGADAYQGGGGSYGGFVFLPTSDGFGYDDTDGAVLQWNSGTLEYDKVANFTIDEWPGVGDLANMLATVVAVAAEVAGLRTAYVFGTLGQSTGLHYYSVAIGSFDNTNGEIGIGLALAEAIPNDGDYTGVGGFALISSGLLSINQYETSASTTFTTGDVIVVAYNANLGFAWIGKVNGAAVDYEGGGDPVTGTFPTVDGLEGTYYPYFVGAGAVSEPAAIVTANFGAITFSPAIPTGYIGWYNAQFTPVGDSEVFVHTINQLGAVGAWSRYVFPFPISYFTQLGNDLYARSGDTVYRMDTDVYFDNATALVDGDLFASVIQWGWLDFGQPGVTKQMIGFDMSGTGTASVQFGYDQRNLSTFTTAWTVDIDTLPGGILPMPIAAPTISVKLTFAGGEAWEWQSFVAYFNDFRLTS